MLYRQLERSNPASYRRKTNGSAPHGVSVPSWKVAAQTVSGRVRSAVTSAEVNHQVVSTDPNRWVSRYSAGSGGNR